MPKLLELLGTMRNDEKLLDEAIEAYKSLLKLDHGLQPVRRTSSVKLQTLVR